MVRAPAILDSLCGFRCWMIVMGGITSARTDLFIRKRLWSAVASPDDFAAATTIYWLPPTGLSICTSNFRLTRTTKINDSDAGRRER
jgi:hypothetical protein